MQIVALTFYRCFQCFLGRSVKSASLWPDGGVHSLLLSLCVAVHVVIWTLCVVLFCASCLCFCLLRSQSCSAEAGFGRSSHTLCSSSNHQRQLKYSWLFPLVASATSGDFLLFLLTPFVPFPEPVQLQTPAPLPPHPPSLPDRCLLPKIPLWILRVSLTWASIWASASRYHEHQLLHLLSLYCLSTSLHPVPIYLRN